MVNFEIKILEKFLGFESEVHIMGQASWYSVSGVIEIPLHIAIDLAILYDVSLDYLVGMDRNK